jgi:hypothetical protein
MSERRRRRLDDDSRGGLPLFPLVLLVILAGLLMGGALAHFFGGSKASPESPPAVAALPSPAATPAPIPTTPPPKATPAPSPSASPTALPTPSATPKSERARYEPPVKLSAKLVATLPSTPTPAQQVLPSKAPSPAPKAPSPAPKAPSPAPASPNSDDRAGALVRSYLEALARGDRTAASSYLASGAPNETFMTPDARIESIRSSSVGPQQYRVTADIQTTSGEYYVTFTVEQNPAGLAITDHFSIKTQ